MNFIALIETNGQKQLQRVSLSPSQSLIIGRSGKSDVIVNDIYVDSSHLQLSMNEDGKIQLADLGSKNGSRMLKQRIVGESPYTLGAPIVIGDSIVSLHDIEAPVVPAQNLDTAYAASRTFNSFAWVCIASLVAVVALLGFSHFLSSEEATSDELFMKLLVWSIFATFWCLLAGFVGKLFRNKADLKLHWVLICFMLLLVFTVTLLVDVLRFNLDSDLWEVVLLSGSSAAILFVLVYLTLSLSARLAGRVKLTAAIAFAVMPALLMQISTLLEEDHDGWRNFATFNRVDQPPALFFAKPITLQEHIRKTDNLFTQLDVEVQAEAGTTSAKNGSLPLSNAE